MEAFDAYKVYLALKSHFGSKSYDYVKYGGKVSATYESFTKRKDKYQFSKLAKKEDLVNFIVANMISKSPPKWPGDLLTEQANKNYREWLRRQQALTYTVQEDLDKIDDLKKSIRVTEGQHPEILKMFMVNDISIETLIIIDSMAGIFKYWNEKIQDPIVWPTNELLLTKYRPMVQFDREKFKTILKHKMNEV